MPRALDQLIRGPASSQSSTGLTLDENTHRRRFLVLGSLTSAAVTAGLSVSRLVLEGPSPSAIVLALLSALYIVAPFTLWLTRSTAVLAWLFPILGALGVTALAVVQGGLFSQALYWLPFAPLLAMLTRGLRGALVLGGLAVVILGGLCIVELSSPARDPATMHEPTMVVLRTIGMGGAALFGALLAAIFELDRRTRIQAIDRARSLAEEANASKTRFLAAMSHELRTPLNSILGFSKILLKNRHGTLGGTELDQLGRINKNGRRLLMLINDVLDMSRLETQRVSMRLEQMSVGELLNEVATDLSALVTDTQEFELKTPPAQPVLADRERLGQVLINLVGNALKFTPEGSVEVRLVVDAPKDGQGPGQPLRVDVIDTGIGIEPEQQKTIFEPFSQADKGNSRSYEGTGLGLAIARDMCRLMGFDIAVTSERRRGSVFAVMLSDEAPPPVLPPISAKHMTERRG